MKGVVSQYRDAVDNNKCGWDFYLSSQHHSTGKFWLSVDGRASGHLHIAYNNRRRRLSVSYHN